MKPAGEQAPAAAAVDRGLDWLIANQAPSGELPCYAGPIVEGAVEWEPDTLVFVTALTALACAEIDDPRAETVIDRAVAFLRSERAPGPLWRYWAKDNEQVDLIPFDTDVVACCSMAVALRGDTTASNIPLLFGNRDRRGLFHTWMLPRRTTRSLRFLWAMRDELRPAVRARRAELFDSTEAEPDDIDAGVNVNILRYLGPRHAPDEVVRWIQEVLRTNQEHDCDKWYRSRFVIYAFVGDAYRRGITGFACLRDIVVDRVIASIDDDGGVGTSLDTALALLALQAYDGPDEARHQLRDALVARQSRDGSWERSVFYYGGPLQLFGWGSEAMATAFAIQAIAAEG